MRARACLASEVIASDEFLSLSPLARTLYVLVQFAADADGVCCSPAGTARMCGCGPEHVRELVEAGLLIESGAHVVVTHWWVHNNYSAKAFRTAGRSPDVARLWTLERFKGPYFEACPGNARGASVACPGHAQPNKENEENKETKKEEDLFSAYE